MKWNMPKPQTGLNFGKKGNSSNSANKISEADSSPEGKNKGSDEWGTTTPEVNSHINRKFSDFEVAKNHVKSKRKESNITEEVLEEDDEQEWEGTEDID